MHLSRRFWARGVLAVLMSVALTGPAHASEPRIETTTNLVVLPGTLRTVFHDGDPVRLCFQTRTERRYAEPVTVSVDQRQDREGAPWTAVSSWRLNANHTTCWTTRVRVTGPHDPNLLLRARTLRGPGHERSVSTVRTLDLTR